MDGNGKNMIIDSVFVTFFSAFFSTHDYLKFSDNIALNSALSSVFGFAIGLVIGEIIYYMINIFQKYNKVEFERDDNYSILWFKFILFTFIFGIPFAVYVLKKTSYFPEQIEANEYVSLYVFVVLFFCAGLPFYITFFYSKVNLYNPIIKYIIIFSSAAIPFSGFLNFWVPIIINLILIILSVQHYYLSKKSDDR